MIKSQMGRTSFKLLYFICWDSRCCHQFFHVKFLMSLLSLSPQRLRIIALSLLLLKTNPLQQQIPQNYTRILLLDVCCQPAVEGIQIVTVEGSQIWSALAGDDKVALPNPGAVGSFDWPELVPTGRSQSTWPIVTRSANCLGLYEVIWKEIFLLLYTTLNNQTLKIFKIIYSIT